MGRSTFGPHGALALGRLKKCPRETWSVLIFSSYKPCGAICYSLCPSYFALFFILICPIDFALFICLAMVILSLF